MSGFSSYDDGKGHLPHSTKNNKTNSEGEDKTKKSPKKEHNKSHHSVKE